MKAFIDGLGLVIIVSALALHAVAARAATVEENEQVWSGTLSAVDLKNQTLTAGTWWYPKTFVIGKKCFITVTGKEKATLRDLRPNEKVRITYQNLHGVLVADQIADESLRCRGTVQYADPQNGNVTIAEGKVTRKFKVADECKTVNVEGMEGSLYDLKPGDKVEVIYGLSGNFSIAYRINQLTLTWEGKLEAIDLLERIVKADDPLGVRQFSVAVPCRIVVGGKKVARLSDLKLGCSYTFAYELVNGVNVADQICEMTEPGIPGAELTE